MNSEYGMGDSMASKASATTYGPARHTIVGFLDLPAEVRCQIYELALTCDTQLKEPVKDDDDDTTSELKCFRSSFGYIDHKMCTAIFRTNRQIYHEAMAVFLKQNLFVRIVTDSEVRLLMGVYGVPIFATNRVAAECKWAAVDVVLSMYPDGAEKETYLLLASHLPLIIDHTIDVGSMRCSGRLQLNDIARQTALLQHETQDLTIFRSWLLARTPFLDNWTPLVDGGAVALRGHPERYAPWPRLLHWLRHAEMRSNDAERALQTCATRIALRYLFIADAYLQDVRDVQNFDAPTLGDNLENEVLATRLSRLRYTVNWNMASLCLSMAQERHSNPLQAAAFIRQMQTSEREASWALDSLDWSSFEPSSEQREQVGNRAKQLMMLCKQLKIDPSEHRKLFYQDRTE